LEFKRGTFPEVPGIEKLNICKETYKKATQFCPNFYEESFNMKFLPTETCDEHVGRDAYKRSRRKRF